MVRNQRTSDLSPREREECGRGECGGVYVVWTWGVWGCVCCVEV